MMIYVEAKDGKWDEEYVLFDECPSFIDMLIEDKNQFSCRKDGKSPLAGTTYRVTWSKKYSPCKEFTGVVGWYAYVCSAGCDNPRAPKIFYETPYGC